MCAGVSECAQPTSVILHQNRKTAGRCHGVHILMNPPKGPVQIKIGGKAEPLPPPPARLSMVIQHLLALLALGNSVLPSGRRLFDEVRHTSIKTDRWFRQAGGGKQPLRVNPTLCRCSRWKRPARPTATRCRREKYISFP